MRIAFVSGYRKEPEKAQIAFHEANGIPRRRIYVEGQGSESLSTAIRALRPGDMLEVIGFRVLGSNRREILAGYEAIRAKGAGVLDAKTGERAKDDGAVMLAKALASIQGDASATSDEELAERARKGGEAMRKKALKKRMNKRDALVIWKNPDLTVAQALKKMKGWTQASAYRDLKSRGIPAGRRTSK